MTETRPHEFDLKSIQFRQEREQSWRELEGLIDRIEQHGPAGMLPRDLQRLPTLYRGVISSLSVARAISLDKSLLDYLVNLAGRAYLSVYSSKRSAREAVAAFFARRLPEIVRGYAPFLAAAVATLAAGVLCGFMLTIQDDSRYYSLVSPETAALRSPSASTESLRAALYQGPDEDESTATLDIFASFLFTHNAKVGILSFALGFLAGAPTVLLLFYNGLILGAMAALYQSRGLGMEFWAWILPHGITELGAVCLCGAAGLAVGVVMVFPGGRLRLDAIALRGREMALVVIGAVMMFLVAALIEGFFRQLVHDPTARWIVASLTLLLWVLYYGALGRRR